MITHYDIKMETQKLKDVLSVEGVNIPPLLQVIRPGGYVFLWVLLWPTFLRLLADKVDIRDAGFDICFSGVMGFILFVAITNGMMLWICPYISRHLLSLNPLQARCRRYSRGER